VQAQASASHDALVLINQWWCQTPWQQYYLHWDDQADWPDPWQLLEENIFCEVARALGIMYTMCMISNDDFDGAQMQETPQGTVVWVPQGKYILNWDPDRIVNITPIPTPVRRTLDMHHINQKVK
jgi:hypothetical protein